VETIEPIKKHFQLSKDLRQQATVQIASVGGNQGFFETRIQSSVHLEPNMHFPEIALIVQEKYTHGSTVTLPEIFHPCVTQMSVI
jgi:hypothetical protein